MKLNILKLDDLYKFEIAKLMHHLVSISYHHNIFSLFTPINVIHKRTMRLASTKQGLFIPRFKTTRLHNSFKYQEVKKSNLVPEKNFRLIDLKLKKKHLFAINVVSSKSLTCAKQTYCRNDRKVSSQLLVSIDRLLSLFELLKFNLVLFFLRAFIYLQIHY